MISARHIRVRQKENVVDIEGVTIFGKQRANSEPPATCMNRDSVSISDQGAVWGGDEAAEGESEFGAGAEEEGGDEEVEVDVEDTTDVEI